MKSILLTLLFALPMPALAADMSHMHHEMPADAFGPAMLKMHAAMPAPTGNIDRDFLAGMIPHHQAAIEMAQIELEQGKDPKVKALARAIIKAQQTEIAQMRDWLKN